MSERPASRGRNPRGYTVEEAVMRYLDSLNSDGSRKTMRTPLNRFVEFCKRHKIATPGELTSGDIQDFGYELKEDHRDGNLKASTANTYYDYVRAFLSFCVRNEMANQNPAKTDQGQEYLPDDTGDRDAQYWTTDQRSQILNYVTQRLDWALDGKIDVDPDIAYRDRTMVVLLARTGARGAELFNDLKDRERTGVTWGDVDLENAVLYVFGKGRKHNQEVPLPKSARDVLDRWRRRANPPSDDWPIFPSWSYRARRKQLEDEIGSKVVSVRFEERGDVLKTEFLDELLEEYDVAPPAISKERARQIMKQLTDEANIDVDDRHGYLTPHGARRRLGADLYAAGESERAQDALRHNSIETTHEAYSHLNTKDTADTIDEVLEEIE